MSYLVSPCLLRIKNQDPIPSPSAWFRGTRVTSAGGAVVVVVSRLKQSEDQNPSGGHMATEVGTHVQLQITCRAGLYGGLQWIIVPNIFGILITQ